MAKIITIGTLQVEVPDDSPMEVPVASGEPAAIKAEQPDEPAQPSQQPYIYQPSDPLRSPIDRIEMLGNLDRVHKPWVRKMFVAFFLVLPACLCQAYAFSAGFDNDEFDWKRFALGQLAMVMACGPYLALWLAANARRKAAQAAVAEGRGRP